MSIGNNFELIGNKTGSSFYPHDQLNGNSGVPVHNYRSNI